jgi:hypothetical protein
VAQLGVLPQHLPAGTEENIEKPHSQDSCLSWSKVLKCWAFNTLRKQDTILSDKLKIQNIYVNLLKSVIRIHIRDKCRQYIQLS